MMIDISLELLEELAPEEPLNQDEQGGCVWCGGTPPGETYGYATSDPAHHSSDCPWLKTRTEINALKGIIHEGTKGR